MLSVSVVAAVAAYELAPVAVVFSSADAPHPVSDATVKIAARAAAKIFFFIIKVTPP